MTMTRNGKTPAFRYPAVVCGGTFDGLHKGHKMFLRAAFAAGSHVTIGLTSEAYIRRFKSGARSTESETNPAFKIPNSKFLIQSIRPYADRKEALESWLRQEALADRATIVPLDNIYGPAALGQFDAIVVTGDSKKNALLVNSVRKERGLPALAIIDVALVSADDAKPISSTRIRRHEIDGKGHLILPDALRPQLQQPLGVILTGDEIIRSIDAHRGEVIVTVGDVTTKTLLDAGHIPNLSIIDNQVNRKPFAELSKVIEVLQLPTRHVKSGPGFISSAALDALEEWAREFEKNPLSRIVLEVDGEEDLLTLPAIGHAPVGAIVYYGQPAVTGPSGLVEVTVTRQKKKEVALLLQQFTSH